MVGTSCYFQEKEEDVRINFIFYAKIFLEENFLICILKGCVVQYKKLIPIAENKYIFERVKAAGIRRAQICIYFPQLVLFSDAEFGKNHG